MKRPAWRLALLVFFLAMACTARSPTVSVDGLEIDPNPMVSFLTLSIHPGMTKELWTYSFFGDGRVQFDQLTGKNPPKAFQSWTTQLSAAEMRGLLFDLAHFGLLDLDPQAILKRERSEGKYRLSPTDQGSMQVDIGLRRKRWAGLLGTEIVKHRFSMGGGGVPSPEPDIPVFEAYRRVMNLAAALHRRAVLVPEEFLYSFPQDDRPVMILKSAGTQVPITTSLTLYASGAANLEVSQPPLSKRLRLGKDPMDRVLRALSESRLAEYDEAATAAEMKVLAGGRIIGNSAETDRPSFSVMFRVLRDPPGGQEREEVSRTVVAFGPSELSQRFPTLRAFNALTDLEDLLWQARAGEFEPLP